MDHVLLVGDGDARKLFSLSYVLQVRSRFNGAGLVFFYNKTRKANVPLFITKYQVAGRSLIGAFMFDSYI